MKIKISSLSNLDENVLNSPVITAQVMFSGYSTRQVKEQLQNENLDFSTVKLG